MNSKLKMSIKKLQMLTYSCVLAKQKLSWLRMSNESIILKEAKKFPKFGFSNSNLINGCIRQPFDIM